MSGPLSPRREGGAGLPEPARVAGSGKPLSRCLLKNKMEANERREEGPSVDLGLRNWKTDELAVLLEGDRKGVTKGLECSSVQRESLAA